MQGEPLLFFENAHPLDLAVRISTDGDERLVVVDRHSRIDCGDGAVLLVGHELRFRAQPLQRDGPFGRTWTRRVVLSVAHHRPDRAACLTVLVGLFHGATPFADSVAARDGVTHREHFETVFLGGLRGLVADSGQSRPPRRCRGDSRLELCLGFRSR